MVRRQVPKTSCARWRGIAAAGIRDGLQEAREFVLEHNDGAVRARADVDVVAVLERPHLRAPAQLETRFKYPPSRHDGDTLARHTLFMQAINTQARSRRACEKLVYAMTVESMRAAKPA